MSDCHSEWKTVDVASLLLFPDLFCPSQPVASHLKWSPQIEFLSVSTEESPGSVELDEVNVTVGLRSHLLQYCSLVSPRLSS